MKRFLIPVFILSGISSYSQLENVEYQLETTLEETELSDESNQELLLTLSYYSQLPIRINSNEKEHLRELNILSPIQLKELENHLAIHGELLSAFEFQVLPSWNLETIRNVLPYIELKDQINSTQLREFQLTDGKAYVLSRVNWVGPQKSGYSGEEPKYAGNSLKLLEQFRYNSYNRLKLGLTLEKDPGERISWEQGQKGFDFVGGYLGIHGGTNLKSLIVGDYQLQLGQGLILWQGNSFGKSADPVVMVKNSSLVREYSSADEISNSRGFVGEWKFKNWRVLHFASYKKIDGSFQNDKVTGWTQNGLHRTSSEIDKRKALTERMLGGSVGYEKNGGMIHLNLYNVGYGGELIQSNLPYQKNFVSLQTRVWSSLDYKWGLRNFYFFGETGTDNLLQYAMLNGMMLALGENFSLSLSTRYFSKGFYTPYNASFGRVGSFVPEQGTTGILSYSFSSSTKLSGFLEHYEVKALRYLVSAPSVGTDYLIQVDHKFGKKASFQLRYRTRLKEMNSTKMESSIKQIEEIRQAWIRFQIDLRVNESILLKMRWEQTEIDRDSKEPERGIIMFQDLVIKPKFQKWSLSFRYAVFSTDSYDSRIYAYEASALYVYSVPAFYYKGNRLYVLGKIPLGRNLDFWIRYAQTTYRNKETISSGNEQIKGAVKREFLVQCRWKLDYSKSKWKAERRL